MLTLTNKLYESLLDDEEDLVNDNSVLIERFLKDTYDIDGTYTIKNGIVDVNGDVYVYREDIDALTNDLFKFGKVTGNFVCSGVDITSLKGAPEKVGRVFNCRYCRKLKSLEGAPKEVGSFDCAYCNKLESLNYAPKKVNDFFNCSNCKNLKNLKGSPEKINGMFDCMGLEQIKDLTGAPKEVGSMDCSDCDNLKSLKGMPDVVKGNFTGYNCGFDKNKAWDFIHSKVQGRISL